MQPESPWHVSAATAAGAPDPPEPEPTPVGPWRGMWLSPRRTVRGLMAMEQRPSWIPVVALAGINSSLILLINQSGDALREPASALGFAVFQGGLQLVYGVLISPFIIALVGGWLGAEGDADDVRLAVAWGYVPLAATLILWLPLFAAYGWDAVRLETQPPTTAQAGLMGTLYLPIGLAPMYSYILQLGGIAAALRTSLWRALIILIIPLIPLILLMGVFR